MERPILKHLKIGSQHLVIKVRDIDADDLVPGNSSVNEHRTPEEAKKTTFDWSLHCSVNCKLKPEVYEHLIDEFGLRKNVGEPGPDGRRKWVGHADHDFERISIDRWYAEPARYANDVRAVVSPGKARSKFDQRVQEAREGFDLRVTEALENLVSYTAIKLRDHLDKMIECNRYSALEYVKKLVVDTAINPSWLIEQFSTDEQNLLRDHEAHVKKLHAQIVAIRAEMRAHDEVIYMLQRKRVEQKLAEIGPEVAKLVDETRDEKEPRRDFFDRDRRLSKNLFDDNGTPIQDDDEE